MRIETAHPGEIGQSEWARWRGHQAAAPVLASPYFAPDWAQIVGSARADARICVIEGGRGFLGVQRPSRFAAMGLGAPLADYQGAVGEPGLALDAAALCRALGVGRIDLSGLPEGQTLLAGHAGGEEGSWVADIGGGAEAYRAHLKAHRGKVVRQTDNRLRKLDDAHGTVRFTALSDDHAAFETLLAWKGAQLRESGQPAIWAHDWVRAVAEACFAARGEDFSGAFFTLHADEKLVAASFCLRSRTVLHCWVLGHDHAYDAFSPGVALARWVIEWAAESGLQEVDFGCGDYQFKRHLTTLQRPLAWGAAARPSWAAVVRGAEIAVRRKLEACTQPTLARLPGKAMRRLDLARALG
ncbi:MAG: GNAT family N-acetyltransferase [Hyphomonadaceae bacterium]